MTAFPDERSVERHALRFLARTLAKREWTHEGRFAAALWLLRNRPDLARADGMRPLISRYNEPTGTPNTDSQGYHHTITMASIGRRRPLSRIISSRRPFAPCTRTADAIGPRTAGLSRILVAGDPVQRSRPTLVDRL